MWGAKAAALAGPFDLICASDVAYDHRAVGPLIASLQAFSQPRKAASQGGQGPPALPAILLAFRCSDVVTSATLLAEQVSPTHK